MNARIIALRPIRVSVNSSYRHWLHECDAGGDARRTSGYIHVKTTHRISMGLRRTKEGKTEVGIETGIEIENRTGTGRKSGTRTDIENRT
ncbi:hypothetical protein EVAR_93231_1 [Eumeta japonica]|uniref:Uncharacterized protein n=1 Tax=Eumeta variegata TaxID=151549 RepID=A0A4C1TXL2_EUMVA|nr:hypothetical protein EVAR_93231_1 [Eumeta japonica]